MATAKTVWGIDIGQYALKAMKLQNVAGELQVDAFEVIEHAHILSEPDADRRQIIRTSLETFLSRNSTSGSVVAVAVPGQNSLTRFVKLPPVEAKKIPDIVRFEAEQQIPFPIEEVIWRWQTFHDPDSPDVEVGIFAMKQQDVSEMLEHFDDVSLKVDVVQMAPLALYNFMICDGQTAEEGAALLADIGANKTDLVISDGARVWTRTIQIGGSNFTEALVRAFKLSFPKAEKLKRTAASSKYARQIFQAMRPVFADLAQEIQRSIGYYTSLHRDARFQRLVGLGNGFRLPGLQKYLEQNLNIPVARLDSYNKLVLSSAVSAPIFNENVLSSAVAYGMALQAIQATPIETNLLPEPIVRRRIWARKRPWFIAAAAVILAAIAGPLYRARTDLGALARGHNMSRADQAASRMSERKKRYDVLKEQGDEEKRQVDSLLKLFDRRDFWPSALAMVSGSIRGVTGGKSGDQDAFAALGGNLELQTRLKANKEAGRSLSEQEKKALQDAAKAIADFKGKPRNTRRYLVVEKLTARYLPQVEDMVAEDILKGPSGGRGIKKPPPGAKQTPGFVILLQGRTPLPRAKANTLLTDLMKESRRLVRSDEFKAIRINDGGIANKVESMDVSAAVVPGEAAAGAKIPDPLFPNDPKEDMANDTRFTVCWILAIETGRPGAPAPPKP